MSIDVLTIGQAKELTALLTALLATPAQAQKPIEHGLKIVVLDKGFVYIGHVVTDGEWVHISNAYNIRRWGTTKGLGELVNGPTSETVLDAAGNIKAPFHALQQLIAVKAEAWASAL